MTDGEHAHFVAGWQEAVQGNVAGSTEGDHQLAKLAVEPPPDQGVLRKHLDRPHDRRCRSRHRLRLFGRQEFEGELKVIDGSGRVDYSRQGFGRAGRFPCARRSSHACTSSAA